MSEQLKKVRHDIIRYANCWEDAEILLTALKVEPGERVFSIGSAGDNSFSLLTSDPEFVLAVDINTVQLKLIELKKACFLTLDHVSFLEFLGFRTCDNRKELWKIVQKALAKEDVDFWNQRWEEIEDGVIYQGKFEKYFQMFRKRVLPFIHSKKCVNQLLIEKDAKAQKDFFNDKWNTWRWRMLFKIFFSKFIMGRLGRDPKFLKEVDISVSNYILGRAKNKLSSVACQKNYLLHFIMKGYFDLPLPHYARKENYAIIKSRVDRLQTFHGLAEQAFIEHQEFDKFNLSNIFEYMDSELFKTVSQNLVDNGTEKARYAYWNLMVPRFMSSVISGLHFDDQLSSELGDIDKGFFYSNFRVDYK